LSETSPAELNAFMPVNGYNADNVGACAKIQHFLAGANVNGGNKAPTQVF